MTKKRETKPEQTLKAGALLCPVCCVEYIEVKVDLELDGVILQNVKAVKCPSCGEELFTQEQQNSIIERIRNHTQLQP